MGRGIAAILAGRESHPNWKPWLSASRGRMPDGATIASVGALANLGHRVSDQTVGKHSTAAWPGAGAQTEPKHDLERVHSLAYGVLAGIDFFTVEVLTWRGLVTYYVLFFIHLESRRVSLAGITRHPDELGCSRWPATRPTKDGDTSISGVTCCMIATRNSAHRSGRYWLLRDQGHCPACAQPNLNAYAERWVLSAKQECLSRLILFGEGSLRRALREFIDHFHTERNHQGKSNVLLFPAAVATHRPNNGAVLCRERLGGLLKYYCGAA